ncbi:MAG: ribosomal-processing cysteine protease Prp [Candidatus Wallbacteria bacterium]|nr:ribosomal-processing cysteine protease Prp [Candidatus Wallbacteria bacterium]
MKTERENHLVLVKGHAGFAGKGLDIVCSAVSALVFTYLNSLRELLSLEPVVVEGKKNNSLSITMPQADLSEAERLKADLLFDSLILGLREIGRNYGDYLRIIEGGSNGS